jgi:predicted nucleic acid-binding protein
VALGALIDSNVLLDIIADDPRFAASSADALASAAERGPLYINTVIYAEVSVRFSRIEELDAVLPASDYRRLDIP